jgi:hypothetical protein
VTSMSELEKVLSEPHGVVVMIYIFQARGSFTGCVGIPYIMEVSPYFLGARFND